MEQSNKSNRALMEEAILSFWKEKGIFEQTLSKTAPAGEFVFYEGPPTANAKPALHHLEARVFKDAIPRYKTMQGYHVRRKAGWDTHGLPVELQIEKALGLESKKKIEEYGIALFNKQCKESVHQYIDLWKIFTERIGYWVDFKDAYYTYDASYIESLWHIVSKVEKRGLLYKDYKVVPWCPRCGTGLSSHELAQGYMDVKDLSLYAKFKVLEKENTYLVAWTTTPWTLPGNVALAVGKDISYVNIKKDDAFLILAKDRLSIVEGTYEIVEEMKGSELVGMAYESLYPYLKASICGTEREKLDTAYKVYDAAFVTTTDGTGIVHTAVMYGQDDFELGTSMSLPKYHTVDETGHFIAGTDFLEGRFVKDEAVAVDIIKDLAHRGLLFKKEKYEHTYPHCWRCKTPLIYYARNSWYIGMSKLREALKAENQKINWEPAHIKEGRFGEWVREVKDWAISRERYWGTPLPLWMSNDNERLVVDSIDTLKQYSKKSGNNYFVMRHGETEHNVKQIWSCDSHALDPLTAKGEEQVSTAARTLADKNIDIIIASPFPRTQQTAKLVARTLGISEEVIMADIRLGEWNVGSEYDGKDMESYFQKRNVSDDRYHYKTTDGESFAEVFIRSSEFLYEIEEKHQGKNILVISHGAVTRALELASRGVTFDTMRAKTLTYRNFDNAEIRPVDFVPLPHNENYELDLHRPYIDEVVLYKDNKEFTRVKEVMDVWFDSGAMPFAQDHYPFENKEWNESKGYPADFISEAIDQTRGWFYTLLAVGVLMERGTPYKNVICLGHLLDAEGKKMSKSVGNIVEPFEQMDKFGVDAVRFWMYSVNQPGESKNYDEKTVAEINNKVFNLLNNVYSFYELYRDRTLEGKGSESNHVLDRWITSRLNELISSMTKDLDAYELFRPTRAIREFIDDLSTWYVRRSRDRMRDGEKEAKQTLYTALKTLAQLLAPFAPFTAEDMWQKLRTNADEESVHLSSWPTATNVSEDVLKHMQEVREICALGNAERKKINIPVRQPLGTLSIRAYSCLTSPQKDDYINIILEELNVKNLVPDLHNADVHAVFDTTITLELKAEGTYREFIRAIQDLRKVQGLEPSDMVTLTISPSASELLSAFMEDFKKTVQAAEVTFAENDGEAVSVAEHTYSVRIEKQ
jgi:isoleucyl-tRNA synthetase